MTRIAIRRTTAAQHVEIRRTAAPLVRSQRALVEWSLHRCPDREDHARNGQGHR